MTKESKHLKHEYWQYVLKGQLSHLIIDLFAEYVNDVLGQKDATLRKGHYKEASVFLAKQDAAKDLYDRMIAEFKESKTNKED